MVKVFKAWVSQTVSFDYLASQYHISRATLSATFNEFLNHPPNPQEYFLELLRKEGQRNTLGSYLLIDADWFGHDRCFILYKNSQSGQLLFWRFSGGEYWVEILADLLFISRNGYEINGIVSDGRSGIAVATRELSRTWGKEIPHQRCLVHVQLSAQRLITRKPKTQAGRELLEIAHLLNQIKSENDRRIWVLWLERWSKRHHDLLKERSFGEDRWWYTHRYLRRAYRSLVPTNEFFRYLEYPNLPKDTNGIEGTFSQLDSKIQRHKGLTQKKKEALISYLLVFKEFPNYSPKTNT